MTKKPNNPFSFCYSMAYIYPTIKYTMYTLQGTNYCEQKNFVRVTNVVYITTYANINTTLTIGI